MAKKAVKGLAKKSPKKSLPAETAKKGAQPKAKKELSNRLKSLSDVRAYLKSNGHLRDVTFINVGMRGKDFKGVDFSGSTFVDCGLRDTNLRHCNLRDVTLCNTDIGEADTKFSFR